MWAKWWNQSTGVLINLIFSPVSSPSTWKYAMISFDKTRYLVCRVLKQLQISNAFMYRHKIGILIKCCPSCWVEHCKQVFAENGALSRIYFHSRTHTCFRKIYYFGTKSWPALKYSSTRQFFHWNAPFDQSTWNTGNGFSGRKHYVYFSSFRHKSFSLLIKDMDALC